MKILWIVLGVVVAVGLILLLPATGYASYNKSEVIVTLHVKASASSAMDTVGSDSIVVEYANPQSVSYFQYIGTWWGSLIGPGQVLNDSNVYIQVHIWISHEEKGIWTQSKSAYGYQYAFGDSFERTFNVRANHNDKISAAVWVCVGDSILNAKDFAGIVP